MQNSIRVSIATPSDSGAWESYVDARGDAAGYHSWRWRQVFSEAFAHEPVYLIAREGGLITGVLPLVQIKSLLFGRTLTSLPFLNYGGVMADGPEIGAALVDAARQEAGTRRCSHVELRHVAAQFPNLPCKQHKVSMRLATGPGMWEALDRKVRNQIRKAEKSGLVIERGGAGLVGDFYDVFARNMRDLGTPVYSRRLFEEVMRVFPDRARLHVVRLNGLAIAAGLTYRTPQMVQLPWASSLRSYNPLCPNVLLYWDAIQFAHESGAALFDMGRSTPNEGTFKFKAQWGAEPVPLHWEYQLLQAATLPNVSPANPKYQFAISLWQKITPGRHDARRPDDRASDPLSTMTFQPIVITVTADPDLPPADRHGEPIAVGISCPRGSVPRSERWALTDQRGRGVPVQTTVLDRWGDGSVRWLLAEFQADVDTTTAGVYALAPDATADQPNGITIEHAGESLRVRTGVAAIDVPRSGSAFLAAAEIDGRSLLESTAIVAEDAAGERYQFSIQRTTVERSGGLSAVIRLDGELVGASKRKWLDATIRLQFFAGLGTVKAELSVTNPRAAIHPGGLWDLGDAGSVLIRDLSIALTPTRSERADVWGSLDATASMEPAGDRFAVHQESSGGQNWQHENHVNRSNKVPARFRGFRAVRNGREVEGLRATPIASIGGGETRISVALPLFWQVFPKAIEADTRHCAIAMFPRAYGDLHELQGGERSTLSFAVCFGRDQVTAEPLSWIRSPLRAAADPASYRQAGVWAPLGAGSALTHEGYDALVSTAVRGPKAFTERREIIDEFGWRHFGELYADHEGELVSHYNNQYDGTAGFITRFLQTADHRWWTLGNDLAGHVTDIDLYHTTEDRAAYSGGYFWHTEHYKPACTAGHRAYTKRNGSSGGGPASEHNYTTGLMLHHFLTGSERSRAAVLQLANWVLDMDDGRKSRFRWIDRRDTGLASVTRSPDYHGPGRGVGNSINALVDAHRLTGESRYLDKAETLIARSAHPDDDPGAIDPLDAENRWSYTVFLQVLGKYLEHRAERGLIDAPFEYARAVLLKYAAWMSVNERPILDTPERLEYPNESWAAQDIRKVAVFEFAARHAADDGTRASLSARAGDFLDYVVSTLSQTPRATLTRPLIVLLAYGFMRPLGDVPAATAVALPVFERQSFTPLKQRVVKRLAFAGAGLAAALVAIVVFLAS